MQQLFFVQKNINLPSFFREIGSGLAKKLKSILKATKPIDLMGKWGYNTAITYETGRLKEKPKEERQMSCMTLNAMTERMPGSRTEVWNGLVMLRALGRAEQV